MKITPLEIRQKTFEKKMRGYSKEDVDAFLQSLSYEWERVNTDKREMQSKIDVLEKDVEKLREVESSLYKTLKTAEQTGSNLVEQANKQAELSMREAQMSAEAILNEAKQKAKDVLDEADELVKNSLLQMRDEIIRLEQDYRSLENMRDNLIQELKNVSNDTVERANKLANKKLNVSFNVPEIQTPSLNDAAKELLSKKLNESISNPELTEIKIEPLPEPELKVQEQEQEVVASQDESEEPIATPRQEKEEDNTPSLEEKKEDKPNESGSFFDSI